MEEVAEVADVTEVADASETTLSVEEVLNGVGTFARLAEGRAG